MTVRGNLPRRIIWDRCCQQGHSELSKRWDLRSRVYSPTVHWAVQPLAFRHTFPLHPSDQPLNGGILSHRDHRRAYFLHRLANLSRYLPRTDASWLCPEHSFDNRPLCVCARTGIDTTDVLPRMHFCLLPSLTHDHTQFCVALVCVIRMPFI